MIESYLNISGKTLGRSLRNKKSRQFNIFSLVEVYNLRAREWGLESYIEPLNLDIQQLFNEGFSTSGAFPQLMRISGELYLLDESKISKITQVNSDGTFTLSNITLYDINNKTNAINVTPGGQWHLIDLQNTFLITNKNSTIFKLGGDSKFYVNNYTTVNTGISDGGRSLLGGFNKDNFWNPTWKEFWKTWSTKHDYGLTLDYGLDQSFIMWSTVGGGDVFHLFYPEVFDSITGYDSTDPYIFTLYKRGDIGFIPMTWRGTILQMLHLNDTIAVYGDNGISLLKHFNDPAPTYGERVVSNIGINNRGAVAGSDSEHIFIDKNGYLYTLNNQGVTQLGYEEFFSPMVAKGDIFITYNYQEEEFYITNDEKCYLLNKNGLTEIYFKVKSYIYYNRSLITGRI